MKYHPVVEKIKELLVQNQMWFETFEHEEVRTSEEAAKVRPSYSLSQGAKALIVRVKNQKGEKAFAMIVISADKRFNNTKAKQAFLAKDIRFATKEEVASLTDGVMPGGVPPFGNLFDLNVYVDSSLFTNKRIVFNAGDRRFSIAMKSEDYKDLVKPMIVAIT